MKNTYSLKKSRKLFPLFLVPLIAPCAQASVIVTLDPADAKYAGDTTAIGGSNVGPTNQSNGLTFNITFTPTAADLTGLVTLIEIGGQTNGTAIYLLNGVPVFLSKTAGGAEYTIPDTTFDTSGIAVAHSGGSLTAGSEVSVAAIYNSTNGSLAFATSVGSAITTDSFSITDPKSNWNGNNSLSAGLASVNLGDRAGSFATGAQFAGADVGSLENALGANNAYYWNDSSGAVIPEPSSAVLGALGLIGLLASRRRD